MATVVIFVISVLPTFANNYGKERDVFTERHGRLVSVGGAASLTTLLRIGSSPSPARKYDEHMGCWSTLKIGNVAFGSWKNGVDDSIIRPGEALRRIKK
jgi:hypothetical protein